MSSAKGILCHYAAVLGAIASRPGDLAACDSCKSGVGVIGLSARSARCREAHLAGDPRAAAQSISARVSHG